MFQIKIIKKLDLPNIRNLYPLKSVYATFAVVVACLFIYFISFIDYF